jgi:hypothetical protein
VCQKQLETVVPRPGELVLMLRGAQKMQRARLMQKDSKVMMMLILMLYMMRLIAFVLCF